ncbi:MAG: hypothetical protein H6585_03990 [Flavobacteriales bacterium]|nr:hypothetical protein [Flavobacteriales bacterium]MCB9447486.1 hypothetical protein [Flavobacteriales bacterium]
MKKFLRIFLALLLLLVAFLFWYKWHFSMDRVSAWQKGNPQSTGRVLIATQGSDFKDAVTGQLADTLAKGGYFVQVADVDTLPSINPAEWDAIAILHTWELWQPPKVIAGYFDSHPPMEKLVVLTTSGDSHYHIDGVDAITCASLMEDAPQKADEMYRRIEEILTKDKR